MRVLVAALLLFVVDLSAQERVRRTNDPHQKSASERKLENVSALVKGQCIDGDTLVALLMCMRGAGGETTCRRICCGPRRS